MKLAYIVTTACGDPNVPHMHRAELLHDKILPAAVGFDEVIVVGRCDEDILEDFPDVTYLHVPPLQRDRMEAFRQREIAARWSTADIFVCAADDHMLGDGFAQKVRELSGDNSWDLVTPTRYHGVTGEKLNNGEADGYSPWHVQALRRWIWAMVPFTTLKVVNCDIAYTKLYENIDAKMRWGMGLACTDVEIAEGEK